eukprot:gnl/TRDRNA2_/TRDRNA2_66367_c0_seq2.p1 gnl/TRDRNA2_/TRDRNA2_66367_c0~~gnl/TRDRNA2_/TRDRNA2_66367_c0_seq2.p1  ORF type:complete len:270 (-),score=46.96 gnl/TRDRNA2_/TRDRNA2_66367_c0_seq2:22-831(-)
MRTHWRATVSTALPWLLTAVAAKALKLIRLGQHEDRENVPNLALYSSDSGIYRVPAMSKGPPGSCECLKWSEVYSNHGVKCGAAHELDSMTSIYPELLQVEADRVAEELCSCFFEKINDNICMNTGFATGNPPQWCYVSSDCFLGNAGGGKDVEGSKPPVSVKLCGKTGSDKRTRDWSSTQLLQAAELHGLPQQLMRKMAYPLKQDFNWKSLTTIFGSRSIAAKLVNGLFGRFNPYSPDRKCAMFEQLSEDDVGEEDRREFYVLTQTSA